MMNKTQRKYIVESVLRDVYSNDITNVQLMKVQFAFKLACKYLPDPPDIPEADRKKWLNVVTAVSVDGMWERDRTRAPYNATYLQEVDADLHSMYISIPTQVWAPRSQGTTLWLTVDQVREMGVKYMAELDSIQDAVTQLASKMHNTSSDVRAILFVYNTAKKLAEHWPNGYKYYKDMLVNPGAASTALVPVDALTRVNSLVK